MVLFVSPLYGALIARPLIDLTGSLRQVLRASVWLPQHGQHYVFKGTTVHVLEDEEGWRWRALAGAGIVADSDPRAECEETDAKIVALKEALIGV